VTSTLLFLALADEIWSDLIKSDVQRYFLIGVVIYKLKASSLYVLIEGKKNVILFGDKGVKLVKECLIFISPVFRVQFFINPWKAKLQS